MRGACRVLHVRGARPSHVPPNWEVYNAPRPIYGDERWQGGFITGVFFTAVDPEGPDADLWREKNAENAAVRLVWVDEETAFADQREWYLEKFPDTAGEIVDEPEHREHVVQQYFRRKNKEG